jgi:hypothetical protein
VFSNESVGKVIGKGNEIEIFIRLVLLKQIDFESAERTCESLHGLGWGLARIANEDEWKELQRCLGTQSGSSKFRFLSMEWV